MGQGRWRALAISQCYDHPNSVRKLPTSLSQQQESSRHHGFPAIVRSPNRLHSTSFQVFSLEKFIFGEKKIPTSQKYPKIPGSRFRTNSNIFFDQFLHHSHQARPCQTPCFESRDLGTRRSRHRCAELGGLTSCTHEVDGSYREGGPGGKKNLWSQTTIKTMGVDITTIVYLRVLIIQIGSTFTRWWQLKHFFCSPRKLGKISNFD